MLNVPLMKQDNKGKVCKTKQSFDCPIIFVKIRNERESYMKRMVKLVRIESRRKLIEEISKCGKTTDRVIRAKTI